MRLRQRRWKERVARLEAPLACGTPLRDMLSRVPSPGTTFDAGQLLGNGIGNTVSNAQASASFERRQTDTVAYWSPVIHGFQPRIHYALNDGATGGNGAQLLSVRASYAGGPFTITTAYETHHDYGGLGTNDQALALYGDVGIDRAKFGVVFTRLSYERAVSGGEESLRVNNWTLFAIGLSGINVAFTHAGSGSGSLKGLAFSPTGQVAVNPAMFVGQATSGGDTGAHMYEVGYDYFFPSAPLLLQTSCI